MRKETFILVGDMPKCCSECKYDEIYDCNTKLDYKNVDIHNKRHLKCPLQSTSKFLKLINYNKNYFNKDGSYGYTEEESYENLNKLEEALGGQDG